MKLNPLFLLLLITALAGCAAAPSETNGESNGESNGGLLSFLPSAKKPDPITIPVGTSLEVRTTTTLSTAANSTGELFVGHLEGPLIVDGRTVAAKGAQVSGRVASSDKGGRVKGVAKIVVTLTSLETAAGKIDIQTGGYTSAAKKTHGEDAKKIGIGAGVGAAIGVIAGGGSGAAKGAGVGAGAGTGAVLATRGAAAVIPAESVLPFKLTAPLSVLID